MNEYDFDSEEGIDLTPEEQTAAAMLGLGSTKRLSKKAYAEFKKKAEDIVAQSSVPSKTAREAAKGIVKGGGTKSAEVSARAFKEALEKGPIKVPSGPVISDLPSVSGKMGAAVDKLKSAAAGVPWQPADGVINLPAAKSPSFLEKVSSLAKKASPDVLEKMGFSKNTLASLFQKATPFAGPVGLALDVAAASPAGEDSDIPKNPFTGEARQLSSEEAAALHPGTTVDYYPPSGRSEMNPTMASSKYDSLENIIADTSRLPEDNNTRMLAASAQPEVEEAKRVLAPKPRMVSAGEPSATQIAKQAEDAALDKILNQRSEYEDLLARYKEAEERQRLAQLGVSLGQAGERVGSAIAMVKPGDQSFYEQQMKLAGGITDEFKEEEAVRREAEKNDPKSETSVSMRNLLKEQGITVPETISAAFIEKQYPQFANIIAQRRAAEERAESRRERAEERADRALSKLDSEKQSIALRIAPKIQNKQYETLAELQAQKALIDEAVTNPNPQRDTTMFYSFVKALDPNSVVREGEIRFSQAARSIPSSVRGLFNKGFKGQMLLPEERRNIQDFMNQRLTLARSAWEASASPFLKQADEAKIDRELVAPGTAALAPLETKQKNPKVQEFADKHTGGDYNKALQILEARRKK